MNRVPRILPLVGIAIVGVLAINALAGAADLPELLSGARAFAEEAVQNRGKDAKPDSEIQAKASEVAATGAAVDASATIAGAKPQAVCAPTAAELAKEAGLSPAELQVLQNLGARRGQLEQRESDMETQLALMAAAEAKLDAKVRVLSQLKIDVQKLLAQANSKDAAEIDRLVKVFESMKPKDSAPRMMVLEDSVRIPIAAKMKDRALAAMLAQMPPAEAKKITEALARQFAAAEEAAAKAKEELNAAKASTDPTKVAANTASPMKKAAPKPKKKAAAKPPANSGGAADEETPLVG